jgi:hypothetical protein
MSASAADRAALRIAVALQIDEFAYLGREIVSDDEAAAAAIQRHVDTAVARAATRIAVRLTALAMKRRAHDPAKRMEPLRR